MYLIDFKLERTVRTQELGAMLVIKGHPKGYQNASTDLSLQEE